MDYLKHFNLGDRPFKNTYDGKFFYRSAAAEALFEALRDPLCPPLVHLKGRDKVGKTSILRRLPVEFRDGFRVTLILNPQMTLAEVLRQALTDFGLSHKFNQRTAEEELLGYFQNAVSEFLEEGDRVLLAVDNADEMKPEFLAEFHGLTEMEAQWSGRVILLLAGSSEAVWPMVPDILTAPREVELSPLSVPETEEYVLWRLKAVGGGQCFSRGALKMLWEYSAGRPETINQLAERALIAAWSSGRPEVASPHLRAARTSLDTPLAVNQRALDQAARGQAVRPEPQPAKNRLRPLVLILLLIAAGFLGVRHFAAAPAPSSQTAAPLPDEPVLPLEATEPAEATLEATPAGDNAAAEMAGVQAPSLPTPPPQLLTLPQGALVLAVDNDTATGRLWQGGLKGPGLKAEMATPPFKNRGLYLFGRPRGKNPLIFQYPPARDLPRDEARTIWPRVATLIPQNILPVIVGTAGDFNQSRDAEAEEAVRTRVKAWVQSQQYRFPDTTAALYAATFQFFELGRQGRTMDRENFRKALNSEARTSGEVNLSVSQPLIVQDPAKNDLYWAVFTLKYESRLRNDMGLRVLIFEKSTLGSDWPIVAELWLPEKSLRED